MSNLQLSTLNPDFDSIKAQIRSYLINQDSWKNMTDSPVADSFIDVLASIAVLDQVKILRATQERFQETAQSTGSIYSIADASGVRLTRKTPSECIASITSVATSSVILPPYSTFEYSGTFFFNRESIILPPGISTAVTLYQGQVIVNQSSGLGEDYATFVSPEAEFSVSDTDVSVVINTTKIGRVTDGIWTLANTPGFQDRTLPDGRLVVIFGNSLVGSKPASVDTVYITYVVTLGLSANTLDVTGKVITLVTDPSITGSITTPLYNGRDQDSPIWYKNLSAPNFGTFSSAVTKTQYVSTALQYPEVIDAVTTSQRESNPYALAWMNTVRISLLTAKDWTQLEKAAFIKYMEDRSSYTTKILLETPTSRLLDITASVFCYTWANLSQVKTDVETAIQKLFELRSGILGYDFYRSDIAQVIKSANSGIEYFEISAPLSDLIVSNKRVDTPTYIVTPNSGGLAIGTYYYGISVDVGLGSSSPSNYAIVNVTSNNSSITLSWPAVAGAMEYDIYGRTETNQGKLITLSGNSTTFRDDGSGPVGLPAPVSNESATQYIKLNSTDISASYSTRVR